MKRARRIAEFLLGAALGVFVFFEYCNQEGCRYLLDVVLPNRPLRIVVSIALLVLAVRLVGGAQKDYGPFFYRLLTRIFGDPRKKQPAKRADFL